MEIHIEHAAEVRTFRHSDMEQLGVLYSEVIKAQPRAVFWWIGDEANWPNVYVAIENGRMIAKGQVAVIATASETSSPSASHQIYVNIKTLPERETDYKVYGLLYDKLAARAAELGKAH